MGSDPPEVTAAGSRRRDVADIDELRQRLRALGYLEAGIDRLVLGSVAGADPVRIALFASLRIGTLSAALLGPTAAIALVARMPELVTGPRDAAVAAVYLGLLFGAAIAAAAFTTSLAASSLAKTASDVARVRRVATMAGILVTAACLAYLTLWWKAASSAFASSSSVWTAGALGIAAAISVLLGHAVTVLALAVTMARAGHAVGSARVPRASWRGSLLAGVTAFAGAVVLLVAAAPRDRARDRTPAPLTVQSGEPVVVLAIDGLDPQLHERLRSSDTGSSYTLFPGFGSTRARLAPLDSRDPARLWTTIATGMRPEAHGVDALETREVTGLSGRIAAGATGRVIGAATDLLRLTRPTIASTVERRGKTFWEIAEQAGLRTAAVNWWATWPAPAAGGIVFSDRAVLRLERGGPLDAEIAPPQLYESLRARWPDIRADAQQRADSYFSRPAYAEHRQSLTRSGELDVTLLRIADIINAEQKLDLLVVYLPGLDIAQHALLGTDAGTPSPFELNQRLSALQSYYEFLESQAGPAMERWSVGRRAFIIAQAGRVRAGQGTLAARGPGLKSRASAHGAGVDIAPTILHALGVPIARDLDGRVIEGLFEPQLLTGSPVRFVDTYGERPAISVLRSGAPLDQEMIDRLRSLGYVK